jgi:hypothetical protein
VRLVNPTISTMTATLQILSNDPNFPDFIALRGVGSALRVTPEQVYFDATGTGTGDGLSRNVNLTNVESSNLTITGASILQGTSTAFTAKSSCSQIAPNGSCEVITGYPSPSNNVSRGLLQVATSDPATAGQVFVQGQATPPKLSVWPSLITVKKPGDIVFSIENLTEEDLTISYKLGFSGPEVSVNVLVSGCMITPGPNPYTGTFTFPNGRDHYSCSFVLYFNPMGNPYAFWKIPLSFTMPGMSQPFQTTIKMDYDKSRPLFLSSNSLAFGLPTPQVGMASSPQAVTILNTSGSPRTITATNLDGGATLKTSLKPIIARV